MHCTCSALLSNAFIKSTSNATTQTLPFLLPTVALQRAAFSTSPAHQLSPSQRDLAQNSKKKGYQNAAKRIDASPFRGQSAMRRTGLNRNNGVSVSLRDLPKPRLEGRSAREVNPNHGLWQFFGKERQALATPEQLHDHGRGWTVEELRAKDWHDLHRLWWVCVKELNRLNTAALERERMRKKHHTEVYSGYESNMRLVELRKTMKSIRATLLERFYAFEDARVLAMQDPEVNLYATEPADALRLPEVTEATNVVPMVKPNYVRS